MCVCVCVRRVDDLGRLRVGRLEGLGQLAEVRQAGLHGLVEAGHALEARERRVRPRVPEQLEEALHVAGEVDDDPRPLRTEGGRASGFSELAPQRGLSGVRRGVALRARSRVRAALLAAPTPRRGLTVGHRMGRFADLGPLY